MIKNIIRLSLILLFFSTNAFSESAFDEAKIFKNIRCLVCQGQSIADSNSEFAQTIKIVVRDQIKEGKNEKEIYDFLSNKFGEWIIYKPKLNYRNSILWFVPYLSLILGGILIYKFLRKRKNQQ